MVIIKNNVMYYRSVCYVLLLVIFGIFGYVFINSGLNTKTRVRVDYQDKSEVYYQVNYMDNNYDTSNNKYVANMVESIDFKYGYNNLISEYVSGYYRYNVDAYLIAYEDDINVDLWKRKYNLIDEKTVVINENNVNHIKIDDVFTVDFKKYRDEIYEFIDNYDILVSGYLSIRVNILESLNFNSLDNEYSDNKVIRINIPLTDNTFKIDVNNIDSKNNYYEFTNNVSMNIVLLIIGAFCVSVSVSLVLLVVRQFGLIYSKQSQYKLELKRILSKYDCCIVRVKKLYVNKKYNLIYVDSFDELMDVYDKKNKMISFKEVKRDSEAIFVIIDDNDAWIYKLV